MWLLWITGIKDSIIPEYLPQKQVRERVRWKPCYRWRGKATVKGVHWYLGITGPNWSQMMGQQSIHPSTSVNTTLRPASWNLNHGILHKRIESGVLILHAPRLSFNNYQHFVNLVLSTHPLVIFLKNIWENFRYHVIWHSEIFQYPAHLRLSNNKYPVFIIGKSAMLFLIQMWYRMCNYSRAVIQLNKIKNLYFPNIKLLN